MAEFAFSGKSSGDYECFCWDVTPEEYKRVTGRELDSYDGSKSNEGLYRIYPGDILNKLNVEKDKLYTFTVSAEEIKPMKFTGKLVSFLCLSLLVSLVSLLAWLTQIGWKSYICIVMLILGYYFIVVFANTVHHRSKQYPSSRFWGILESIRKNLARE